ncbi:MAG: lipoyl synthase, partial [Candidatus Thorarchaeota archaeon]
DLDALQKITVSKPDVIGHNIETTEKLTPLVRDRRASYEQSILILKSIKKLDTRILTKSSIMLGLGETDEQVLAALQDLKRVNVDIVTIGQYLQPSRKHLNVVAFLEPQKFKDWEKLALEFDFLYVASGPLVRSSYRAGEFYVENILNKKVKAK